MHDPRALRERHWLCAQRLRERRNELRLTQQDVVDRLGNLGVVATNRTLSAIEHGQGVDIARLPELAAALDCTVTYLLGLTADPQCWQPDDAGRPVLVPNGAATFGTSGPATFGTNGILGPDVPEHEVSPAFARRRHA